MISFKMRLLIIGLSVAALGGALGKLAIDHHLPWQSAEANSDIAEINNPQQAQENSECEVSTRKPESSIIFT